MITLSIATFKGGQSKTFISAMLCRELAKLKKRVLAVSVCSQNDINFYLGGEIGEKQLFHAVQDNNILQSIVSTKFNYIDLIPQDVNKSPSIDALLQTLTGSEKRLNMLFKQVKDKYDYIICDTPPSLNISTIAALVASDYLISPSNMRWSSINGYLSTDKILNELIDLELCNCKNLGLIRTMNNIMRDTESFEVENYIIKNNFPIIGNLPSSSALRTALYLFKSYDDIKNHHKTEINKLFNNILNTIGNGK